MMSKILGIAITCLLFNQLTINAPDYLEPGSNIIISWKANGDDFKAEFGGKEIPVVPLGQKLFCFAGIDVRAPAGSYKFVLFTKKTGEVIWQKLLEQEFAVKELKTKVSSPGKKPVRPLERAPLEKNLLDQAFAKTSALPLFQGLFVQPLKKIEITKNAGFGVKRIYTDGNSIHAGVDLKAPMGTKVKAINSGRVLLARNDFSLEGGIVIIDHGCQIFSFYLHLQKILVKEGDEVTKNQTIGLSGESGKAKGPHLHFAIKINNNSMNPLEFIDMFNAAQ